MVSRASRKYKKCRSYIYFWRARWDGNVESLVSQSRHPHSHPNQHTESELKLIRDMRRRNPQLGLVELWHRLKHRGYTRRLESMFQVMRKLGMFPQERKKTAYTPKPYQQMTHPGEKVAPLCSISYPMRPLHWRSPLERLVQFAQQTYSSTPIKTRLTPAFSCDILKIISKKGGISHDEDQTLRNI